MKRHAIAVWKGSGKEGKGHLTTQSGAIKEAKYTTASRFENDPGTNPEELVAAAHAGCFAMKLSFNLSEAGHVPDNLEVKCTTRLSDGKIQSSRLELKADVPGIDLEQFNELVEHAKKNCPISKSLDMEISVSSVLNAK